MPPDDATPGTEPVETAAPAPRGDTARDATAPAARPTRVTPMAQAIIGAGVAAGIVEAAQGVGAALTANAGLETALFVLWQAFGTVVLPAVVLALPVGFVLDRGSMKSFGKDLRTAFTGDRDDATATVGVFAGLFSVGAAAATATLVGRIAKERVSANVTVTITVLAAFVSLAVFVALAGLTARAITPRLRKLAEGAGRGEEFLAGGVAPAVLLSLVVTGALAVLLPLPFVVTGGAAVFGFALGVVQPGRATLGRLFVGRRGVIAVVTLGLVGLSCPLTIDDMPSSVVLILRYRSPVAGALLASVRSAHTETTAPTSADAVPAKPFEYVKQSTVTRPAGLPEHANVIMILVDALRPDHLSFAGYPRRTSPNLDGFRETATWFQNAYAAATSTRFSLPVVFTGMEVEEIPQRRGPGIDLEQLPGATTLATRLGDAGFERMGYTDSYVIQHIRGIGVGFPRWETPWPVDDWQANYAVSGTKTTSAAIDWLSKMPDGGAKPYFLFLHYRCTHDPYGKNARWEYGHQLVDDYDSAVNYCDDEIGRLFHTLDKRQDKDRTAIIVFSDHGELFGEHGFTNHGNTLFQPDVRALLMIRAPGLTQAKTVTAPVSLVDIEPTVLMLAGAPPDTQTHAWNLVPFLVDGDKAANPERPVFMYADLLKGTVRHQARAVVLGHYKLLRDLSTGRLDMFDLAADPDEKTDVSKTLRPERAMLGNILSGWERETSQHSKVSTFGSPSQNQPAPPRSPPRPIPSAAR